ncbi:MAG: hypothetical protein ACYC63_21795 [Armatimonadota bacterium]
MKKALLACFVFLFVCSIAFAQTQGYQPSSVVVGQTAEGKNRIVSVIPLKFMDPELAVQLFGALGFGGTATAIPSRAGGDVEGARRSGGVRPRGYDNRSTGGQDGGYGGYDQALQRNEQLPGYQSPYGNR